LDVHLRTFAAGAPKSRQARAYDLAQPLRTQRGGDVHGTHHVGEQDGDLFVLRRLGGLTARLTALAAELSGLARNFGDVFAAGSGGERAIGVIVGGDALE
jgi:hypothetical protein